MVFFTTHLNTPRILQVNASCSRNIPLLRNILYITHHVMYCRIPSPTLTQFLPFSLASIIVVTNGTLLYNHYGFPNLTWRHLDILIIWLNPLSSSQWFFWFHWSSNSSYGIKSSKCPKGYHVAFPINLRYNLLIIDTFTSSLIL